MIAIYHSVNADRLRAGLVHLPSSVWLPFSLCLIVVGCSALGPVAHSLMGSLRSVIGADSQPGASLGAKMMLGDRTAALTKARVAMLRREYWQCRLAQAGMRRALSAQNTQAAALWQRRLETARSSYDLISLQSADGVFVATGLPRHF